LPACRFPCASGSATTTNRSGPGTQASSGQQVINVKRGFDVGSRTPSSHIDRTERSVTR
jgi:hypothetical protein